MIYFILLLAAALRLFDLGGLPIALFNDEIDVAYHAWSLWQTGRDYMGNLLPTYIQSLSEWRAPLIMYVTAPFVGLLGPNAFAARLPIALLGVLNVYLIYLLTKQLLPQKNFSLGKFTFSAADLAALLLALAPWHLHYSRANFEVTLLLALLLLGTYWFIKFLDQPRLPFSLFPIPFALTFYTYSTANLFTPLLAVSLLLIYRPKIKKMIIDNWFIWLTTLIVMLPISYHLLLGQAAGRFHLISIFSSQELLDQIVLSRTQKWVNPTLTTLFHNKLLKFSSVFLTQYLEALSPQFLFISGDPLPRHSVVNFGQLLWPTAPLFLAGLYRLLNKLKDNRHYQLLLAWLLISPLPSALTEQGGMHATRLFVMLPVLVIISVLGLFHLLTLIDKRVFKLFLISVFLITLTGSFILYFHQYSTHYRYTSYRYWHYGYRQIFSKLEPYLEDSQRVFINNTYEPSLLHFAFQTSLSPKKFHRSFTSDQVQPDLLPGFDGFKFGQKYYFGQVQTDSAGSVVDNLSDLMKPGDIYLAAQGVEVPGDWDWSQQTPQGFESLAVVDDVFGDPMFQLIRKL